MWFYYALFAALLWGIGQVIVKKGQSGFTPFGDNLLATLVQIIIIAPLLYFSGVNLNAITSTLPYAFLTATLYMTYYYILSKGQISLTLTVLSSYPVITIILTYIFLQEKLTFLQICSGILILIGVVILAFPKKISLNIFKHFDQWFIWGIFGAIMIGFTQLFTKIGTSHSDGNTFTFFLGLSYVPALFLCAIFDKKGRQLKSIKLNKSIIISLIGVMMIEADLIPLNLAFAKGPTSLVSFISTTNILFMIILAVVFLHEKISLIQYFGIAITTIGILLISIS